MNKAIFLKVSAISAIATLALTGCAVNESQLTGKDAPTGQGDILVKNHVMSQAEYDSSYSNEPYSFDGFLYNNALNLQLRFQSNEELEEFTRDLAPLQNKETAAELNRKFTGEHILYEDRKISTQEFTDLHKEGKAVWVKCYLPENLLTSDIKAFDSEDQLNADTAKCDNGK